MLHLSIYHFSNLIVPTHKAAGDMVMVSIHLSKNTSIVRDWLECINIFSWPCIFVCLIWQLYKAIEDFLAFLKHFIKIIIYFFYLELCKTYIKFCLIFTYNLIWNIVSVVKSSLFSLTSLLWFHFLLVSFFENYNKISSLHSRQQVV